MWQILTVREMILINSPATVLQAAAPMMGQAISAAVQVICQAIRMAVQVTRQAVPAAVPETRRQTAQPVVVKLHYVIQFDTNGGTNLSRRTMTLLDGDSPGIMPKVQRKDYLFRGWYTQKEGGKQVAGDKPLEEAATLYARWVRASAPVKTASL